eukprot:gene46902-4427_t
MLRIARSAKVRGAVVAKLLGGRHRASLPADWADDVTPIPLRAKEVDAACKQREQQRDLAWGVTLDA